MRSKQTVRATISSLLKVGGSTVSQIVSLQNCCVDSFRKFCTREPDKPAILNNNRPIQSIQFDAPAIMKKLKTEKSSGPDEIHPVVLQNIPQKSLSSSRWVEVISGVPQG